MQLSVLTNKQMFWVWAPKNNVYRRIFGNPQSHEVATAWEGFDVLGGYRNIPCCAPDPYRPLCRKMVYIGHIKTSNTWIKHCARKTKKQSRAICVIPATFYRHGYVVSIPVTQVAEMNQVKKKSCGIFIGIRMLRQSYLIFVFFFTLAKFLENKIYTEKCQFFALNL